MCIRGINVLWRDCEKGILFSSSESEIIKNLFFIIYFCCDSKNLRGWINTIHLSYILPSNQYFLFNRLFTNRSIFFINRLLSKNVSLIYLKSSKFIYQYTPLQSEHFFKAYRNFSYFPTNRAFTINCIFFI